MLFDTHCHLNFKAFDNIIKKVIDEAKKTGIKNIVIPGTDIDTSKKAVKIANNFEGVYASVGIHPHHIKKYQLSNIDYKKDLAEIEKMLSENKKIVAIGEIGIDKYIYQKTKYENYQIDENFIKLQKIIFINQLKLAKKYKKTVVIHNRQATDEILKIFSDNQSLIDNLNLVFHCCEAQNKILDFAIKNKIFIGIDGDIFYSKTKQDFVKKIPLELLVLETDAPFLSPFKKTKKDYFPNEPKNLKIIAEKISEIKKISFEKLAETTTKNAEKLFKIKTN
ncbi:MAG: TatD family hydrolase [Patescibacteria group bacterium]|nr:TatD family hydrolase [Patescibacteria group bacterium]